MALFSRKQNTDKPKAAAKPKAAKSSKEKAPLTPRASIARDLSAVIKGPRITEKASISAEVQGAYVFNISADATKERIGKAIQELYKVTPRKINVVTIPKKKVISGRSRRESYVGGGRKAYVYLKKGDKIEFA